MFSDHFAGRMTQVSTTEAIEATVINASNEPTR